MVASRKNGTSSGELYVVGPGRPPIEHRFKPGNPGRPKGSKNKLGEDFIAALAADFTEHGPETIERMRKSDPIAYLKLIVSVIPKEEAPEREDLGDLSDDELESQLLDAARELRSI